MFDGSDFWHDSHLETDEKLPYPCLFSLIGFVSAPTATPHSTFASVPNFHDLFKSSCFGSMFGVFFVLIFRSRLSPITAPKMNPTHHRIRFKYRTHLFQYLELFWCHGEPFLKQTILTFLVKPRVPTPCKTYVF